MCVRVNFISMEIKIDKHTIIIDDQDYERVKELNAHFSIREFSTKGVYYVYIRYTSNGKRHAIMLPRFILNITDQDKMVAYKDHNTLNLSRANLIIGTHNQILKGRRSSKNGTSKYLGVHWRKDSGKWRAVIKPSPDKKNISLGCFANEEDAARAYNDAAKIYHGKFANLNKID